jgi:hypothetical protein
MSKILIQIIVIPVRAEYEIRVLLGRLRKFGEEEGHLIDEMSGEIYALEYVLEERDDLF